MFGQDQQILILKTPDGETKAQRHYAQHMVDIQRVLNKRINILGIYTDVIVIIARIAKGNKNQNACLQKVYNRVREYMDVKIYKYIIVINEISAS